MKNIQYWLVKSEPFKYSWEKFNQEGRTHWDGVRNYQARNNLRAMREGNLSCCFSVCKGTSFLLGVGTN